MRKQPFRTQHRLYHTRGYYPQLGRRTVCALQRLCAHPRAQPPAHLGSLTTAVVHALIGSVAALTFYFATAGGIISVPGQHADLLLVLGAFGSGFAERLVVYVPRNKS